jgi:hypothetical protein
LATHNKSISISTDGLNASNNIKLNGWQSVYAAKGFTISVDSSGPVVSYFEITIMSSYKSVNLLATRIKILPKIT